MNDALVIDNIGLVHKYALPFRNRHDYDDIISAGIVGLAKAASRYDSSIGRFSSFAWRAIKAAVLHYINEEAPVVRGKSHPTASDFPSAISLDLKMYEESDSTKKDQLADPYDYAAEICRRDMVAVVHALLQAAADIPSGQKSAIMAHLRGERLSHVQRTQLYQARHSRAKTFRRIKEALND